MAENPSRKFIPIGAGLIAVVAIVVLGLFWFLRARRRSVLVGMLLGFALPLALASLAPAAVGFVLDGIWIGTILAAVIAAGTCCWHCGWPLCSHCL